MGELGEGGLLEWACLVSQYLRNLLSFLWIISLFVRKEGSDRAGGEREGEGEGFRESDSDESFLADVCVRWCWMKRLTLNDSELLGNWEDRDELGDWSRFDIKRGRTIIDLTDLIL
jgi:hypothetical protein